MSYELGTNLIAELQDSEPSRKTLLSMNLTSEESEVHAFASRHATLLALLDGTEGWVARHAAMMSARSAIAAELAWFSGAWIAPGERFEDLSVPPPRPLTAAAEDLVSPVGHIPEKRGRNMSKFKAEFQAIVLMLIGMTVTVLSHVFGSASAPDQPSTAPVTLPDGQGGRGTIGPDSSDAEVWDLLLKYGWRDGRTSSKL